MMPVPFPLVARGMGHTAKLRVPPAVTVPAVDAAVPPAIVTTLGTPFVREWFERRSNVTTSVSSRGTRTPLLVSSRLALMRPPKSVTLGVPPTRLYVCVEATRLTTALVTSRHDHSSHETMSWSAHLSQMAWLVDWFASNRFAISALRSPYVMPAT
jgi:hypothetical protein